MSNEKTKVEFEFEFEIEKLKADVYHAKHIDEIEVDMPRISIIDLAQAMDDNKPIYALKFNSLESELKINKVPMATNAFYVTLEEVNVDSFNKKGDLIIINGTIKIPHKGRTIREAKDIILTNEKQARALCKILTESFTERDVAIRDAWNKIAEFHMNQLENNRW